MKKTLLSLLVLAAVGTGSAQAQFFKKLDKAFNKVEKGLDKVGKTLDEVDKALKGEDTAPQNSGTATTSAAQNGQAAQQAEPADLDIRAPRFAGLVRVNAQSLKVRKQPSTSAPYLIRVCEPESDACDFCWSNERVSGDKSIVTVDQDERYLVLEDNGEWCKIIYGESGIVGYISKKFTEPDNLPALTPEMLAQPQFYMGDMPQVAGVVKGQYRGYALVDLSGWETSGLALGRIVSNLLVLNYIQEGYSNSTETPDELSLKTEEMDYFTLNYGKNYSGYDPDMDSHYLDMTKLSETQFAKLISGLGAKPGKPTDRGYIFAATDQGGVYCIASYDLSNPELAGHALTIPSSQIKQ